MIVLITGGICSGKTYISNYIRKLGYEVVDTDSLAKELMQPENEIYYELIKQFGKDIVGRDGKLNKIKLREIVFKQESNRKKLSEIVHPAVKKAVRDIAENKRLIFVETAIPIQADMYDMGKIIYVYAKKSDRIARMVYERDMSKEDCHNIIKSQEEEEKIADMADYIVDNSDGCEPKEAIDKIITELENETL